MGAKSDASLIRTVSRTDEKKRLASLSRIPISARSNRAITKGNQSASRRVPPPPLGPRPRANYYLADAARWRKRENNGGDAAAAWQHFSLEQLQPRTRCARPESKVTRVGDGRARRGRRRRRTGNTRNTCSAGFLSCRWFNSEPGVTIKYHFQRRRRAAAGNFRFERIEFQEAAIGNL